MRLALLLVAACASAQKPVAVSDGVPAVIVAASPESRAALLQAATDALGGRELLLADDAFTRDSTLVLEPRLMDGRETRAPERLTLVKSGAQCLLVHGEQRFVLVHTTCTAVR